MEKERKGGTKKYSDSAVDRRTAKSPGPVPPNHAPAMTAPKNKNRKGYGKKPCSNNVETNAAVTATKAIPYCWSNERIRSWVGTGLLSGPPLRHGTRPT